MEYVILFIGKENACWAFMKPVSKEVGDAIINHQGAWQQFKTARTVNEIVKLPAMKIADGFWVA